MLFIVTKSGQSIKLQENQITETPYIRLTKGDRIVSEIRYNDKEIKEVLCITSKGWGLRFLLSDIRIMGVGGSGVSCMKLT